MSGEEVETSKLCRTCRYWSPLFTGETWGVRSFIDAPADVQAEITVKILAQFRADGFSDPADALDYHPGLSSAAASGAKNVPGGIDWPYWGECTLTDLSDKGAGASLAMAIDGSMYHAILRCRANFGCVQWEALKDVPHD